MDIEPRDGITILGFAVTGGGIWMWVKDQFKNSNARDILTKERILDIETRFERRVDEIESRFTTPNNEPALMTYRAHNHICSQAQKNIFSEFKHVVDSLDSNSSQLKEMRDKIGDMSEKINDMSVSVAVLEGKVERRVYGGEEVK